MKKAARKEDPIILACAAVLALGIGGWVVKSAMDFSKESSLLQLEDLDDPEVFETPAGAALMRTTELRAAVDTGNFPKWATAESAGKNRGFLVSTPLVFKGTAGSGEVLDLDKEQPMLRPPIPNAWLTKHRLEGNYANVGQLDPDGDKFTNEEEYLWGEKLGEEFDPNNSTSHPPYYYKLVFDRLVNDPYVVEFRMVAQPNDYSLKHRDAIDRREKWTYYGNRKKIGDKLPDRKNKAENRFQVEALTKNQPNVITLLDTFRDEVHPKAKAEIIDGQAFDFGDVYALMGYAKNSGDALKLELLEESSTTLEGLEDYTLRLVEVNANQAVIEFTNKSTNETTKLTFPQGQAIKP